MVKQHVQWVGNKDSAFEARQVKWEENGFVTYLKRFTQNAKKIFTFGLIKPFFFNFKRKRCATDIL